MNIAKLLQTIFAPTKDTTPLARLSLTELRDRQAAFDAQAAVLDDEIAAGEPRVARQTAESALGGLNAPSIDQVEQDRAHLLELREARGRLRDVLTGIAAEISARLVDESVRQREEKRAKIVAAHDQHVKDLRHLHQKMLELGPAWKAAKLSLLAFQQELPYTARERFAFATSQGKMLLESKQWLAAVTDGDHGAVNPLTPKHQVLAGPTLAQKFAELAGLLDQVVLRPEDCADEPLKRAAEIAHHD